MRTVIVCALLLLFTSNAGAQFHWSVVQTDFDGRYDYCIDALDCNGPDCTAAGTIVDELGQRISRNFLRSTDNGLTWVPQNSGLYVDSLFYIQRRQLIRNYYTCIQQIDSKNIVAGGLSFNSTESRDTGQWNYCLILRSFDGGSTWDIQNVQNTIGLVKYIHFSDPSNGILLLVEQDTFSKIFAFGPIRVFTTEDGGVHWSKISIGVHAYIQCHAFGKGKFCILASHGRAYSTLDNWKTIDSSEVYTADPIGDYQFKTASYSKAGDTIIAYGQVHFSRFGFLIRSTDKGNHWSNPFIFDSLISIDKMSSIDRDTIIVGGESTGYILKSTNRGESWRVDPLLLDTVYPARSLRGISITGSGNPIAAFGFLSTDNSIPSILVRGEAHSSGVERERRLNYNQRIYPNPATKELKIASVEPSTPYRIKDILGRTVKTGMVGDGFDISVDVTDLPRGIYFVFVDDLRDHHPVSVGKVMIVGK